MADVNFNLANPYQSQLDELARRQKMAEIMQQQSFQPTERFSYAGIEAPISPLAGLTKALQGYMGGKAQRDIANERKAVGEKSQSDLIATMTRANELAMGKPAVPEGSFKPETADFQDNPNLALKDGMGVIPAIPAVAPNREAAALEYFKHPATQAMGMAEMQKSAQLQRLLRAGQPAEAIPVAGQPTAASQTPVAGQQIAPTAGKPVASTLTKWGQPAGGQPFAVWMEIDPSGKLYTEQLAKEFSETNKPTDKIRELRAAGVPEGSPQWNRALTDVATQGGIWQRDAQGNPMLAPGYATGQGEIKGAEARATAENAISTREVGGRNVTGTDRQFKILATGEAPTNEEAQKVNEWAVRNNIGITIKGPVPTGQPATQQGGQGTQTLGGVSNPTAAESAQAKEFATGSAAAINKRLESSYDLAKNSVERINTINDLKSIVELPAFSGPGATTQLLLGQLANKFYGATNAETLANTTLKLQGLADLSLKAAGLIKGQGSITEPERALLAKAKSAPENLTVPEYKALFKVLEKQDAGIIREHQDFVKRSQKAGVPNADVWSVDVPIPSGLNLSPAAQKLLGGGR
jgi:hypothetical protein